MNRPLMPSAETSLASHNRESGTALPSGVAAGSVISASQEKAGGIAQQLVFERPLIPNYAISFGADAQG